MLFSTCSRDNEPNSDKTSLILPKKVTYIENIDDNNAGQDSYLTYNGNKLVSVITSSRWKSIFTYTGDLITKIEDYDTNKLFSTTTYNYTNGKLASRLIVNIETLHPYSYTTYYVHNTDGTVSYSSINGNGKLTFKNGNLVSNIGDYAHITYEYDTKNNPFKNILGIDILVFDEDDNLGFNISKNNCIKTTEFTHTVENIITYDSNGYATDDKECASGSTTGCGLFKYSF